MARIVGRTRINEKVGTGVRGSELVVFILIAIGLVYAARYYFVVYRNSPSFALGEYLGAIKAGDVTRQYALIDSDDKRNFFPTQQDYTKSAPQARGYTMRITDVKQQEAVIDPKKPHIARINATVSMRKPATGEALYETGSDSYNDSYTLRKDSDGHWKVWLGHSQMNTLKSPPNPPGDPINN
jgi:hypothetical protein